MTNILAKTLAFSVFLSCLPNQDPADEAVSSEEQEVVATPQTQSTQARALLSHPPEPTADPFTEADLERALFVDPNTRVGAPQSLFLWERKSGISAFAPQLRTWLHERSPAEQDRIFWLWATSAPEEAAIEAARILQDPTSSPATQYIAAGTLPRCGEVGIELLNSQPPSSENVQAAIENAIKKATLYPYAAQALFGENNLCSSPTSFPNCPIVAATLATAEIEVNWAEETADTRLIQGEGNAIRTGNYDQWLANVNEASLEVLQRSTIYLASYDNFRTVLPGIFRTLLETSDPRNAAASCRILLQEGGTVDFELASLERLEPALADPNLSGNARVCLTALKQIHGELEQPLSFAPEIDDSFQPLLGALTGEGPNAELQQMLTAEAPNALFSVELPQHWRSTLVSLWIGGSQYREMIAIEALFASGIPITDWNTWLARRSERTNEFFATLSAPQLADSTAFGRFAASRELSELVANYATETSFLAWALQNQIELDPTLLIQQIETDNNEFSFSFVSNQELATAILLRQGGISINDAISLRERLSTSSLGFTSAGILLSAALNAEE